MYYDCNKNCRICNRLIISTAVTVVTIDGVDTLVIDLPAPAVGTTPYLNGCKYCVVVAQAIPTTATIAMPVAFSIGGDTTTVYPFVNNCCQNITACAIQTRTKYPVCVSTTATGGVFKSLRKLNCYPTAVLASLPVPATDGGAVAPANIPAYSGEPAVASAPVVTNTRKTTSGTVKALQTKDGESSR